MLNRDLSELIARMRRSDEAAAKELVERLYPTIIRIVRNHLPRRELEEALVGVSRHAHGDVAGTERGRGPDQQL